MNLLGRRSLSSFFKVLLDVAFYLACLAGGLLVVVAVVASRADNSNVSISLPVRFEIDPSAYRIQGAGGAAVHARIEDADGRIRVTDPPVGFATLPLLSVIAVLAVVVVAEIRTFPRAVSSRGPAGAESRPDGRWETRSRPA